MATLAFGPFGGWWWSIVIFRSNPTLVELWLNWGFDNKNSVNELGQMSQGKILLEQMFPGLMSP